jgi:hypothetical protein
MDFTVSSWDQAHPRWLDLRRVVEGEGQTHWVTGEYIEQFIPHHWLVATDNETGAIVGFLMFTGGAASAGNCSGPLSGVPGLSTAIRCAPGAARTMWPTII